MTTNKKIVDLDVWVVIALAIIAGGGFKGPVNLTS